MKKQKIVILFLALLQLICGAAFCALPNDEGKTQEPYSEQGSLASGANILRVGPTSTPPIIDGNLIDKCWQDATIASGFIALGGGWPGKQTTGYVTYDDTCLYIAFSCNEAVTEKIKAKATKNDELGICGDDSVAYLFFDIQNHILQGGRFFWIPYLGVHTGSMVPNGICGGLHPTHFFCRLTHKVTMVVGREAGTFPSGAFRVYNRNQLWQSYADGDVGSRRFIPDFFL